MTTIQAKGIGSMIVANILIGWGYKIEELPRANLDIIQAVGPDERRLVQVNVAVYPETPEKVSLNPHLIRLAHKIKAKVWVAQVQLTQDLKLQLDVLWTRMSQ